MKKVIANPPNPYRIKPHKQFISDNGIWYTYEWRVNGMTLRYVVDRFSDKKKTLGPLREWQIVIKDKSFNVCPNLFAAILDVKDPF